MGLYFFFYSSVFINVLFSIVAQEIGSISTLIFLLINSKALQLSTDRVITLLFKDSEFCRILDYQTVRKKYNRQLCLNGAPVAVTSEEVNDTGQT